MIKNKMLNTNNSFNVHKYVSKKYKHGGDNDQAKEKKDKNKEKELAETFREERQAEIARFSVNFVN